MLKTKIVDQGIEMFSKKVFFETEPVVGRKAHRSEEVVQSTITVNGITFDADESSMDRMDRVIDLANWKYNQQIALGVTPSDAYASTYSATTIPWKTADNQLINISVETICKAQELALENLAAIWVKYG